MPWFINVPGSINVAPAGLEESPWGELDNMRPAMATGMYNYTQASGETDSVVHRTESSSLHSVRVRSGLFFLVSVRLATTAADP